MANICDNMLKAFSASEQDRDRIMQYFVYEDNDLPITVHDSFIDDYDDDDGPLYDVTIYFDSRWTMPKEILEPFFSQKFEKLHWVVCQSLEPGCNYAETWDYFPKNSNK